VHQDVNLYSGLVRERGQVVHDLAPGRRAWIHVASGDIDIDGTQLAAGDAVGIEQADQLVLRGITPAELLVFDLTADPKTV
jgi:redox-sensitive bicupin YhaK (pirin superfamily)